MTLHLQSGLGLYPQNACFQPNRPSWLPYWWPTTGEYACVVSGRGFSLASNPPPPPAAPQTEEEMLSWTPEDIYATEQQWEAWKDRNRALIQTEGAPPSPSAALADWWDRNKWYVLGAGLGVLAVVQMTKR